MLAGVVVLAAAAAAVLLVSRGSSGNKPVSSTSSSSAGTSTVHHATSHHHASVSPPANAAEVNVAVLNGTETAGLAHRFSARLQQRGYSQAAALAGNPPGSNQTTVVQYASGHRGDAEGVARMLSVNNVQPLEGGVSALAPSASVVVVVGADKAATGP